MFVSNEYSKYSIIVNKLLLVEIFRKVLLFVYYIKINTLFINQLKGFYRNLLKMYDRMWRKEN